MSAVEAVVLDASAILAVLQGERGADLVEPYLANARVSSVSICEVVTVLIDRGRRPEDARAALEMMAFTVVDFDRYIAVSAAELRSLTRDAGLSTGDRACLATAATLGLPVITADRIWSTLALGVDVKLVR